MTIYLDILIGINILFTYIFIVCVRAFISIPTNGVKVILASLLGGLSSVVVLLGDKGIAFSVLYNLISASVIVLVAFTPKKIKLFIKEISTFFGVSFLFGGIMYFLQFLNGGEKIIYINGAVYFDISLTYLVVSVLLIYGIFILVNYLYINNSLKNEIYSVSVSYKNIKITMDGFVDTGNFVKDPFSGTGVFIGELKAFEGFFTDYELSFLQGNYLSEIPKGLIGNFKLVPYKTAGNEGLMPCFKPDSITIKNRKEVAVAEGFYIGLVDKEIGDGQCSLILNKSILDLNWRKENEIKAK